MKIDFMVKYNMFNGYWYISNSENYYIFADGSVHSIPWKYISKEEALEAYDMWANNTGVFPFIKENEMKL